MAFPEDPLGLLAEILVDGRWEKLPLYTRNPINHQRGIRNEGTAADPAAVPLTINNKNGRYSPRNPLSPLYGKIGRNTRVRLSLPGDETYLQLDGSPSAYASTPDTAALDLTKDIDLRWEGEADWYSVGAQMLVGKWGAAGQRSYHMRLQGGSLYFHGTTDGTIGTIAQWPLPAALPRRAALRATLTGGTTCRWYWATSLDGTWEQFGELVLTNPFPSGVFVGTSPLLVAPSQIDDIATRPPVTGRVYRAEVRGAGGTVVASPVFTAQPAGTKAWTDSAGRTWTLSGSAEIRDRIDRFIGEISEWPQKWEPSEADAWVPVQASGVLRRLGQGTKTLDSALRRRIPSFAPLAYWPLEEGEHATQAYSPISGGAPMRFTNVRWAADSSLPSSGPLPTVDSQDGAYADMSALIATSGSGSLSAWSVIWMYHMPQVPPTRRTFMRILSTGTIREWSLQFGPADTRLLGLGAEGETIVERIIATSTDIFGRWVKARFAVEQQGVSVRYAIIWSDINGDAGYYENAVAGSVGRPTGVAGPPGGFHPDVNGLAIGHVSAWAAFDTDAYDNAINAWTGETAGARMQRLANEEGIPLMLTGPAADTEPVGYQQMAPALDLVKDAADADGGMLTEEQTALRLLYRPRTTLYSQQPKLVLDYTRGQIAAPLDPVDDDSAIRNDVTVTREGGSSARVVLASGPLSVQAPPNGVGVYDDSITLSLATDEQTGPKAAWELHLGTWDAPRYPAVTVNLHRHPELIPAVLALREGDVIRLTGMPKWVAPDDVDLMYLGLKETLLPRTWTVTFDCVPAGPWRVGIVDDAVSGRVDTDGTQLAAAVGASDTLLPVTVTAGQPWITANPVLNANPDFAEDLTGWTGFGAAIERVPAPEPRPFAGAWAMQLTPDGVAQYPNAGSSQLPIAAGQSYVVSGWLRCARARSVALNLNWFGTGGAYLATAANDHPVPAGVWAWTKMTVTAPAGAVTANIAPTVADVPPPADVLWTHRLTLRPAGGSPSEFPFDVQVGGEVATVDAVGSTPINPNPFFAKDLAEWSGQGAAIARVTDIVHPDPRAVASMRVTPAGGVAAVDARATVSALGTVTPGVSYTASAWVYSPGGWADLRCVIDWHNAAGTYLSSAPSTATAVPAAQWTRLSTTSAAPASAARAVIRIRSGGTPPATATYYVWAALLEPPAGTGPQALTVTRSVNGISKDHAAGSDVRLAVPAIIAL
ncbi:hypothetical protein AB0O68_15745 [Streptomyces sp. NPDC087512]|uniref:hypothetical protein n=1 Tax=Streptomyces sp. NPDC087512 TaxID=3155059 RepID=UPI003412C7AD